MNLSGNKTVSGLIFDNSSAYTLTGTSSTLTLDNGVAAAAITVNNGSHTIAVPISLNSASSISFVNPSTGLTISGAISGAKPVTVSGAGALTLTGNNSYGPTALLSGATLNVGTIGGTDAGGSLGTGDVTMSGASTLNFNRTNAYNSAARLPVPVRRRGRLINSAPGTTTVSGAISNVTSVNVSAGTLIASSTLNQTGGVNVTGAGSLTASGAIFRRRRTDDWHHRQRGAERQQYLHRWNLIDRRHRGAEQRQRPADEFGLDRRWRRHTRPECQEHFAEQHHRHDNRGRHYQ